MIFFKNSLITFTVLIVAIWVIPVTSDNDAEVQGLCKKILESLGKYDETQTEAMDTKTLIKNLQAMIEKLKMNVPIPEAQCDSNGILIEPKPIYGGKNYSEDEIIELAFTLSETQESSGQNVDYFCAHENLRKLFE